MSWLGHRGGNKWFVINPDNTISPTHAPKMKFGIVKEDEELKNGIGLGLVAENDKDKEILVFKDLTPSVDPELPTLKLEMTHPLTGKGIIWNGDHK